MPWKRGGLLTTVQLLKRLIAFRPVSAEVANVNRAIAFLQQYLSRAGVYTRRETHAGRHILYAATRRGRTPALLFNPHVDVVPAEEALFRPREKNGWLWGRGAGDCLGNCAVMAQALIRSRGQGDVGALFTADEEIGGQTAAAMLDRGYRGRMICILDSFGTPGEIAMAHKGILTLKLTAHGKACHGSMPWKGVNPIDRLIAGYLRVKPLFPPITPGDEWHTSLSANVIRAGNVFNRVPDTAEMILDIRYTDAVKPRALVKRIRAVSGLDVAVEAQCPIVKGDERAPVVREFSARLGRALRCPTRLVRLNGATDARHFARLKVPLVMIGIPYIGAHASDERADIKGMLVFEDFLAQLCREGLTALGA